MAEDDTLANDFILIAANCKCFFQDLATQTFNDLLTRSLNEARTLTFARRAKRCLRRTHTLFAYSFLHHEMMERTKFEPTWI